MWLFCAGFQTSFSSTVCSVQDRELHPFSGCPSSSLLTGSKLCFSLFRGFTAKLKLSVLYSFAARIKSLCEFAHLTDVPRPSSVVMQLITARCIGVIWVLHGVLACVWSPFWVSLAELLTGGEFCSSLCAIVLSFGCCRSDFGVEIVDAWRPFY